MGHIFISYSHKDKDYVHKLQKALQDEGFDVWIDDRIDYGTEWPKVIQEHLDECDAFIVVISESAYESEWVQNEVTRAKRKNKPFFPLLLQGDPWLSVEATQYVNVTGGLLPPDKFYKRLEAVTPRKGKNINQVGNTQLSNLIQIQTIDDINEDTIEKIDLLFSDWASTDNTKRLVLRKLGLVARNSKSKEEIKKVAEVVVKGLYDKEASIRKLAVAILSEIGAPSIEIVLNAKLDQIPGRRHGKSVAIDIFGSMGKEMIPNLVAAAKKYKNGNIVIDALCYRMPIEATFSALKDFFLQKELDIRQREIIYRKLSDYENWYKKELKEFLQKGVKHPDPLVRVLCSRWYVSVFPFNAKSVLKDLLRDDTSVEYNYSERTVSAIVSDLLTKIPK